MKEIKSFEDYPSLIEVREWKDAVTKELEEKTAEERIEIYHQAMETKSKSS